MNTFSPDITLQDFISVFTEVESMSVENQQSLFTYYKSVQELAKNDSNIEFNNNDADHAAIVMSSIFNKSTNSIKIFAGNFKGDVCNKSIYLNSLKKAFSGDENQKKLDVIFLEQPDKKSNGFKLIEQLKTEKPNNITISVLTEEYKKLLNKNSYSVGHFTVGDDKMYRFESDTINYKSFCNFEDKITSEILINNFNFLRLNSKEIC